MAVFVLKVNWKKSQAALGHTHEKVPQAAIIGSCGFYTGFLGFLIQLVCNNASESEQEKSWYDFKNSLLRFGVQSILQLNQALEGCINDLK